METASLNEKKIDTVLREEIKKKEKSLKSLEKKIERAKKTTVKKPRTMHNSELNTPLYLVGLEERNLLESTKEELDEYFRDYNLCMLSNSYGFLTDAILGYLKEYVEGKTNCVYPGTLSPEDKSKPKIDILYIEDTYSNFCNKAGVTDQYQKDLLKREILNNHFNMISLTNLNIGKPEDVRFSQQNFLVYKNFTTRSYNQLKKLKNINRETEAVDKIIIAFNKNIFNSILLKGKKTNTKGFYSIPANLEKWLRDTVGRHKEELIKFCEDNKFRYIKGGDYTKTIRPMFNLLVRERGRKINKPIETYARSCCMSRQELEEKEINGKKIIVGSAKVKNNTYPYDKRMNKYYINRQLAIENMSYALEVLKFLYKDGIGTIDIQHYEFKEDNIIIDL